MKFAGLALLSFILLSSLITTSCSSTPKYYYENHDRTPDEVANDMFDEFFGRKKSN